MVGGCLGLFCWSKQLSHFATAVLLVLATGEALQDQANAPQLPARMVKIRTLGCLDCAGPEQFGSIQGLDVDPEGGAYVVDRFEPFIRVWSAAGELVSYSGLEGDGPGRFRFPSGIFAGKDGSYSVVDRTLRRWTIFDSSGEPSTTRTLRGSITRATYSARDRLLYTASRRPWSGGSCRPSELLRWSLDDAAPTVVAILEDAPHYIDWDCPAAVANLALTPRGAIVVGFGFDEYLLRELDATTGSVNWETTRPIERVPRTAREIEALSGRVGRIEDATVALDVDPLRTHFTGGALRIDADGRIWIRSERAYGDETIFDIFTGSGAYLGEVTLPVRLKSPGKSFALAGEYLLAAYEADDLGTEFVGLWRVR